jgi:hypothetical protein
MSPDAGEGNAVSCAVVTKVMVLLDVLAVALP